MPSDTPNWCPLCGTRTKVTETRERGDKLLRARRCLSKKCAHRFGTMEIVRTSGAPSPNVIAVNKTRVRHARSQMLALLADLDAMLGVDEVQHAE